MAIVIKTAEDIEGIRKSARLAASVLDYIEPYVQPGVSTEKINQLCHDYIVENGATPSPLNYRGYPKSVCTSLNQVVCHGIPSSSDILRTGDIINIDVTTYLKGYHGDTSSTFQVGKTSRAARELLDATKESLWLGIEAVKPGAHFGDIGAVIQKYIESLGFSVVKEYCGHGIGKNFHEDPHVVHYGKAGSGEKIKPGMVFTIEPMINQGGASIELLDDGWTVVTRDNKLSAQFEHTVAVLEDHVEVLTIREEDQDLLSRAWRR